MQYGISSKTLSEEQIYGRAPDTIRVGLISVPGVGTVALCGKVRVISVDLDPKALEAQNCSETGRRQCAKLPELGVFPAARPKLVQRVPGGS